MSSVVVMLGNEGVKLPQPKQPGFLFERSSNNQDSVPGNNKESYTQNGFMTVTFDCR